MIIIALISLMAGSVSPAYVLYRDGILYTLTGTEIPFCDKGSTAETNVNIIYTIISAFTAVCGTVGVQVLTGFTCDTISITTELIISELNELSELLVQNHLRRIEVQMRIERVILQILRSNQYMFNVQLGDFFSKTVKH